MIAKAQFEFRQEKHLLKSGKPPSFVVVFLTGNDLAV
jgi:hypothetical protein